MLTPISTVETIIATNTYAATNIITLRGLLQGVSAIVTALKSRVPVRFPMGAQDFRTTFPLIKCFYSHPRIKLPDQKCPWWRQYTKTTNHHLQCSCQLIDARGQPKSKPNYCSVRLKWTRNLELHWTS